MKNDHYCTYAIGTRKNHSIYLLMEVQPKRIWSKSPDNALVFFTREEAEFVIKKFNVSNASVAILRHKI